jgi:hypothetical protein
VFGSPRLAASPARRVSATLGAERETPPIAGDRVAAIGESLALGARNSPIDVVASRYARPARAWRTSDADGS